MKIVQINSVPNGSTGSIMMNIHKELLNQGHESYVVWGRGRNAEDDHEIYMNDKLGVYFHVLYSRLTGKHGFASKRATKKLLKRLDEIKPDIIHLHNIHGYYINIELLFNYIKKNDIKVIWTLHDCWSFTGHCSYFDMVKCEKWKTGCKNCPQKQSYPKSLIDNSKWCYKKKKEIFNDANITLVTPSKWLAKIVKLSYLKDYDVKVINNGINTEIFKPTPSNFREKFNLQDKKIILGVANVWEERKGLNDFIELSKILDNDFKIVLVGLNEKQLKEIPKNIIGIKRTNSIQELVEIYNSADVLLNPSVEETFSLVTAEAMACGVPCIVNNSTATPELIKENTGIILDKMDVNEIIIAINNIINDKSKKFELNCLNNSKKYTLENYKKYLNIYLSIYENNMSGALNDINNK